MSSRKKINNIGKLLDNNENITNDVSQLEQVAVNYFTNLYNTNLYKKVFLSFETKFLLNDSSKNILLASVVLEDIKKLSLILILIRTQDLMSLGLNFTKFTGRILN